MGMTLSPSDREMLSGARGEAARLALSIITRLAEALAVDELIDVTQVHIDGCGFLSQAGLDIVERLADFGGRVVVPTTLNMGPMDLRRWADQGVDPEKGAQGGRLAAAYESMGCVPTWTCAPYEGYLTPRFGQAIAWGESNAVAYANAVCGARTNRVADYLDICIALTGRAPRSGLYLDENRRATVQIRLRDLGDLVAAEGFYAALGHHLGAAVGEQVPVIEGLPSYISNTDLKALGAAAASAGGVALYHIVGVTPEAPTLEAALQGRAPERTVEWTADDLKMAWQDLTHAEDGAPLDAVGLGCPHYSFHEFARLIEAIRALPPETRCHERTTFLIATSRQTEALIAGYQDWMPVLKAFGAVVVSDTCVMYEPLSHRAKLDVLMTDSGKCAYYSPGELQVQTAFGTVRDCVLSAVEGRILRKDTPWNR